MRIISALAILAVAADAGAAIAPSKSHESNTVTVARPHGPVPVPDAENGHYYTNFKVLDDYIRNDGSIIRPGYDAHFDVIEDYIQH